MQLINNEHFDKTDNFTISLTFPNLKYIKQVWVISAACKSVWYGLERLYPLVIFLQKKLQTVIDKAIENLS